MNLKNFLKNNEKIHKNSFMLDDVLDAVKQKQAEQKEKKEVLKDLRRFQK